MWDDNLRFLRKIPSVLFALLVMLLTCLFHLKLTFIKYPAIHTNYIICIPIYHFTIYPTTNQLRANPAKTQVSLFHLRNRECGKQLNISWNGVNLTHCNLPVYLGVTLDRTLSYKAHIEKTKKKVGTRNNIIRKLRTSKWGATPTTLRSSALALCYSAAEYACPVWERSNHAKKLDATLNETCRMITGCLKPTNSIKFNLFN